MLFTGTTNANNNHAELPTDFRTSVLASFDGEPVVSYVTCFTMYN
ncbi:MAG TPA: hypothetical protein VFC05_14945 [Nitrososphaeraceae archaeon]|nr:hypothetical protein [Nitrososphaeraceae archaeon]